MAPPQAFYVEITSAQNNQLTQQYLPQQGQNYANPDPQNYQYSAPQGPYVPVISMGPKFCFECDLPGHIKRFCPYTQRPPQKKGGQFPYPTHPKNEKYNIDISPSSGLLKLPNFSLQLNEIKPRDRNKPKIKPKNNFFVILEKKVTFQPQHQLVVEC